MEMKYGRFFKLKKEKKSISRFQMNMIHSMKEIVGWIVLKIKCGNITKKQKIPMRKSKRFVELSIK